MVNGTGTTTGPYTLTAGAILSLNDPYVYSICANQVQIQNNTGYTVYMQSSGAGYNIQPFTCSTIPGAGGQTLVGSVSTTANVQTGYLTAVWLLPGQTAPMPDGPMTIFPKSQTGLAVTTIATGGSPAYVYSIGGFSANTTSITLNYNTSFNWSTYQYCWLQQPLYGVLFGPVYIGSPTFGSAVFNNLNLTAYVGLTLEILYGTISAPFSGSSYVGTTVWAGPYFNIYSIIAST